MPAHQHKSGSLKQTNKKHGGVHASKRSLKQAQGGKVNASAVKSSGGGGGSKSGAAAGPMAGGGATVSALAAGSKTARLLATKQARQQKKSREWIERRTGTRLGAPAVVLILPFGECVCPLCLFLLKDLHSSCPRANRACRNRLA
jgi:hypothetical protein